MFPSVSHSNQNPIYLHVYAKPTESFPSYGKRSVKTLVQNCMVQFPFYG